MVFKITGKHITITDAIRAYAEEKTSRLPRFYNTISQVEVLVDGDATAGKVSVEIIARGEHSNVFVATEAAEDALKGIDAAVRKLEEQLRRKKTKERDNKHSGGGHEPA